MKTQLKLLPPMMPNFLPTEHSNYRVRVSELSNEEAVEYGELMKKAFIEHHKEHLKKEKP